MQRQNLAALGALVLVATACSSNGGDDNAADGSAGAAGSASSLPPDQASTNWMGFGHDLAHTRANVSEKIINKETVGGLVEKWVGGEGFTAGTPAVVDGVVYFGDSSRKIQALDAVTGAAVWSYEAPSTFTASATVVDGVVYLGDTGGTLHAIDASNGEMIWASDVTTVRAESNCTGSPLVVGDLVLQGIASTPNNTQQQFRGEVVGVDKSDGSIKWRYDVTQFQEQTWAVGVSVWSSPAVDTELGLMYIGTGQSYDAPASPLSDSCLALEYETGEYRWHQQFTFNDVFTFATDPSNLPEGHFFADADVGAAPNLFMAGDRPAVGVGDKAGSYYAMDRATGEELWMTELWSEAALQNDLALGTALGGVMVAAAVAEDTIFVGTNTWTELSDLITFNFGSLNSVATVFALDTETGAIKWQKSNPSTTIGGLGYAGGVAYNSTGEGVIRGYDGQTGDLLWSDSRGLPIASGMAISNGMLYTGSGFAFFSGVNSGMNIEGGVVAYGLP